MRIGALVCGIISNLLLIGFGLAFAARARFFEAPDIPENLIVLAGVIGLVGAIVVIRWPLFSGIVQLSIVIFIILGLHLLVPVVIFNVGTAVLAFIVAFRYKKSRERTIKCE